MQKKHKYTRWCERCCSYQKNMAYYGRICPDCRQQVGGKREWQKGEASSLLRMKALGVL